MPSLRAEAQMLSWMWLFAMSKTNMGCLASMNGLRCNAIRARTCFRMSCVVQAVLCRQMCMFAGTCPATEASSLRVNFVLPRRICGICRWMAGSVVTMASKEMYERVSHCDTGSAFSCLPIGNFFRLTTQPFRPAKA